MTPNELNRLLAPGAKARLARLAAVSRSTVTKVCKGETQSARLQGLIAQYVGIRKDEIFPLSGERDSAQGGNP